MADNIDETAKQGFAARLSAGALWLREKLAPAAKTAGRTVTTGAKKVAQAANSAKDEASRWVTERKAEREALDADNAKADHDPTPEA